MSKSRNYKEEYKYHSSEEQKKKRAARNRAHRLLEKALGREIKGDVDHKVPLSKGGKTTLSNLRVTSKGENRSFSRNSDNSLKSQTSKREQ